MKIIIKDNYTINTVFMGECKGFEMREEESFTKIKIELNNGKTLERQVFQHQVTFEQL